MRYRVFALVLVAACGGLVAEPDESAHPRPSFVLVPREVLVANAAGAPSSATETESGVLGPLPRTPVDLAREPRGVAPAPGATSCACPSVAVTCSGSALGYASTDRDACTLALAPASCRAIAAVTGTRSPTAELSALVPQEGASPEDLWATCAVAHEARHACDGPDLRVCATEQRAYDTSTACFEAFEQRHCAGAKRSLACPWADLYRRASVRARDFHACLCGANGDCARCADACGEGQDADMRAFCRSLQDAYCTDG